MRYVRGKLKKMSEEAQRQIDDGKKREVALEKRVRELESDLSKGIADLNKARGMADKYRHHHHHRPVSYPLEPI